MAVGVACTPPPASFACESDADCEQGFVCITTASGQGQCAVDDEPDAGTPADAGYDAGLPVDGGYDAGLPVDGGYDAGLSVDGGYDAGVLVDGGYDAGALDGGYDAGAIDAGPSDAGYDGGYDAGPFVSRLWSVSPELVSVGDTLLISGAFSAGTWTVTFGSASADFVAGAGTQVMSIAVPPGASSGEPSLENQATGEKVKGRTLRVTSFEPRLGPFHTELPQTAYARSLPDTADPHAESFALVRAGWLYVFAGDQEMTVERARVHADGSIGAFVTDPIVLPAGSRGAAMALIGGRVWILGGRDDATGNGVSRDVWSVGFDAMGGLTDLRQETTSLWLSRAYARALVIGSWLYVFGGRTTDSSGDQTASIERARIYPDGTLGAFASYGGLAEARDRFAITVAGGLVVVTGGTGGRGTVQWASVGVDGDVGSFTASTALQMTPRRRHATVALGDSVCVLGGQVDGGNDEGAEVECASVSGGTVGTFVPRPPLTDGRAGGEAVVVGNRVLLVGAEDATGAAPTLQAPITAGATLSSSAVVSNAVWPSPGRSRVACAVLGNWLYAFGGHSDESDAGAPVTTLDSILRAPINEHGDLGTFRPSGATLTTPRFMHRAAIHNHEVILVGGSNGADDPILTRERFAWDGDDISPTPDTGNAYDTHHNHAAVWIEEDRLYVTGSDHGDRTIYVRNLTNGGSNTVGAGMPRHRWKAGLAVLRSGTWMFGGREGGSSPFTSVWRRAPGVAEVFADAGVDDADAGYALDVERAEPMTVALGDRLLLIGGHQTGGSSPVNATEVVLDDVATPSAPAAGESVPVPASVARSACAVQLLNRLHVVGGHEGGTSTVDNYTFTIVTP
jgi:hypothetical protein